MRLCEQGECALAPFRLLRGRLRALLAQTHRTEEALGLQLGRVDVFQGDRGAALDAGLTRFSVDVIAAA